ncbi:hypothetical protein MPSI1_004028 [Malassezia psittaci]|uniref:PNPLA domain-containing protein n=1 Tax=Malassezia psittaci TaxID=1821823 RepID=A0AAF0JMR6_9BASI|nr:hypothetical protein MPSI1_004028 [Malassezia psittaci]
MSETDTLVEMIPALQQDYINHEHIKAFAKAMETEGDAGHILPTGDQPGSIQPVQRISAASDFAPIHQKLLKPDSDRNDKLRSVDRGVPEGFMYYALRWPLLCMMCWLISTEFMLYVFIRQVVNLFEVTIFWRGNAGKLRKRMRSSQTYGEWKRAALELDKFRDHNAWKEKDASAYYDWRIIQRVVAALRVTREKEDVNALIGVLNLCLKNNFAGIENFSLYSQSFHGTKHLVEQYYQEVERALYYLEKSSLDPQVKRTFYRVAAKNFGRTALCLSGGASFAYYHFGVVKALLDANLLPTIVSGTSAGGLVAALVCTRTNEELKELLVPELAHRITGCDEPMHTWLWRMYKTGARFDAIRWAAKAMFFTRGSLTFREAYERTGKTLNISVVPFEQHSPAQLLNHINAPDCLIWSAMMASAAVPGILNPVFLMQKLPDGSLHPWSWGNKFRDGSLRVDIPVQQLHTMFNVTYPIVSQVNPHVHLFHYGSKGSPGRPTAFRKGRGWRGGFLLSAAEHIVSGS